MNKMQHENQPVKEWDIEGTRGVEIIRDKEFYNKNKDERLIGGIAITVQPTGEVAIAALDGEHLCDVSAITRQEAIDLFGAALKLLNSGNQ